MGDNLIIPVTITNASSAFSLFYLSRLNVTSWQCAQRLLSDRGSNWLLGYWGPDRGTAFQDKAYANMEAGDGGWLTPNNVVATGAWAVYGIVISDAAEGGLGTAYRGAEVLGESVPAVGPQVVRLGGGIGAAAASGPAEFGSGDIAELLAYDRALTAAEVAQAAAYFCGKYGVCA